MKIYHDLPEKLPSPQIAVALGMFDGLHLGHLAVLNALKEQAGTTATALFTFSTKDGRPPKKTNLHLLSESMRDCLLESLGIDFLLQPEFSKFRYMQPEDFVKDFLVGYLNVTKIFCGESFRFGKNAAAGIEDFAKLMPSNTELCVVPVITSKGMPISTTRVRELIQAGEIEAANGMLGREFAIDFVVVHGRKLGRTLGLPTINQAFPADFVVPKYGVYASTCIVDGVRHKSVTNVGMKPTVGSDHVLAETYIHDYSGDLYGKNVIVRFVRFIREEKKFDSIEELKAQIERDKEKSVEILGG